MALYVTSPNRLVRGKKYRVLLTNGEKWITWAQDMTQARNFALNRCPGLQTFGVHVERVERIETA